MAIHHRSWATLISTALAVFTAGTSTAAFAAEPGAEGVLEEVTVSATRRGNINLQETPLAVTAITADQINRIVPRDVSELAAMVPNFSASRITAFNAASFAMRGAGQTDIIVYLEPPVAVLVDDFVVPSVQTQLLDTFDIESVEVLRGPQGTLFGKNTTGGAVVLRTKRPSLIESDGQVKFGFGSFGRKEAMAAFDLPLIEDKFALRFVGGTTKTDGFYRLGASYGPTRSVLPVFTGLTGMGTGERGGGQDVVNGRIKALWQVTDSFSALAQFEVLRDRSDAVPSVNDTPAEPGCVPVFLGGPMVANGCTFLWNSLGFTRDAGDPIDVAASTNRNDAGLKMGRGQKIDVQGAYLNMQWDINDALTLYSITGQRNQDSRLPNTYTGEVGPVSLFDATRDDDRKTFQQEFRLNYKGDRSSWVFGAFYSDDDTKYCVVQVLGFLDLNGLGQAFFGAPGFFNANPQILCNQQKSKVTAGFADATFDISDKFQIGVGARWTQDKKNWVGRNQVFFQALGGGFNPSLTVNSFSEPLDAADFNRFPIGVARSSKSWSEPTYRLTGSYKFSEDLFGYATYSRGFKAGGYNDQSGTTGAALTPALIAPSNPEFADSFELGLKTELLDRRLRLNGALFYVKYTDAQRGIVTTTASFQETRFFNAADVTVKGLELEATGVLTDNLTLGLSAGYQDGKYDKFEADANLNGSIQPNEIFTGQPLARTPKFSGSVTLGYEHAATSNTRMKWNAMVTHEDENLFILSDLGARFNGILDKKDLVSVNVALTDNDESWFVRLYGKNLTDERYRVAVQPVANLWTHSQFGEPRSYGVEFGVKFGGAPKRAAPIPVPVAAPPPPADSDGDGVSDGRDRCPNTPAGARVDANGCELDADGDGVVDRIDRCPETPAGAKVDANGCELDSDGDGVVDSKDKCPDTPKGDRVDSSGCSFTTEIKLPGVVFDTAQATLLPESTPVLSDAVATLKRYPEIIVEVAGHTDSVGSDALNRKLSQARAETVMAFLKDNGVTNELRARGYGEGQPVASNATAEGRAQNRRVALRILEKK